MVYSRIVGFVQEAEMSDVYPSLLVVFDVLYEVVCVCLSPVAGRTRLARDTAKVATIGLFAVRLHEPWSTPSVGVESCHAVRLGLS